MPRPYNSGLVGTTLLTLRKPDPRQPDIMKRVCEEKGDWK
jgi:hypothetical protein